MFSKAGVSALRQESIFPNQEGARLSGIILFFFFNFWLLWVFVAARGLSLVAVSGGYSSLQCAGFSCCRAWALGTQASVVVALRLRCSTACGIFPDQGSNLCPLHWQVDSKPLRHQGSPDHSS